MGGSDTEGGLIMNEYYDSNHEYVKNELKRAYKGYADSHPSISKMMQLDQVFAKIDEVFNKTTLANEVLAVVVDDNNDRDDPDMDDLLDELQAVWERVDDFKKRKEAD